MSRRSLVLIILAAAALLLPILNGPPASAGTYQYYGAESYAAPASAFTQFYAAHSTYLVSIQYGYVHCPAYNGARVTWCGTVGNNTSHAQAGVNWTANGRSHWMRMDVYAPVWYGYLRCDTRGDTTSFVNACAGVAA